MINNILHKTLIAITNNTDDTFDWYTPLTFTAQEAKSTIRLTYSSSPNIDGLEYITNINSDWSTYTINTTITLTKIGDYVQFQNTNTELSTSLTDYVYFVMSGKIAASGNIQSMLNYLTFCTPYCYTNMFARCDSLITAPELPATNLASFCYYHMFSRCTSLTTAPELPAPNVADSCYLSMFFNCTALENAPTLPAITLTEFCYRHMFDGCTSLTTVMPELPATNLAKHCYDGMFRDCTSLRTAPTLPATNLVTACYSAMFDGCSGLITAPELPAPTLTDDCYSSMFSGCKSLNYIKVGFTDWNERIWNC